AKWSSSIACPGTVFSGSQEVPTVRKRDIGRVQHRLTALGEETVDHDFRAQLKICATEPLLQERIGSAELHGPVGDVAVFVGDGNMNPAVGIGPLQAGDRATQFNGFVGVELRGESAVCLC